MTSSANNAFSFRSVTFATTQATERLRPSAYQTPTLALYKTHEIPTTVIHSVYWLALVLVLPTDRVAKHTRSARME